MDELEDLGVAHRVGAALAPLTWYRCGGPARVLVVPGDAGELAAAVRLCREAGEVVRVLGGGANLLVADAGVDAVVLRLSAPAFRGFEVLAADRVRVGAGHDLFTLCNTAARRGLAGLSQLAGVPGTLGGAIRMNAGGSHGDIGGAVQAVEVVDLTTGEPHRLTGNALRFGYRRSDLGGIADPLVTAAELRVTPTDPATVQASVRAILAEKKRTQPMSERSAGCSFRNPDTSVSDRPAGALIDAAGLKGFRIGTAEVSTRHANFLTLDPDGRADDAIALLTHVAGVVHERFGVRLQREVVVWE